MKKTFDFYTDPGHGWLKVPLDMLEEFGIQNQISRCSMRKGKFAYLEEDCDAPIFEKAFKDRTGEVPTYRDKYSENSRVRNYPNFYWLSREQSKELRHAQIALITELGFGNGKAARQVLNADPSSVGFWILHYGLETHPSFQAKYIKEIIETRRKEYGE